MPVSSLINDNNPAILEKLPFTAQLTQCLRISLPDHDIGPRSTVRTDSFDDCGIVSDSEIISSRIHVPCVAGNALLYGIRSRSHLTNVDFLPVWIDNFGHERWSQVKSLSVNHQAGCHASFKHSRRTAIRNRFGVYGFFSGTEAAGGIEGFKGSDFFSSAGTLGDGLAGSGFAGSGISDCGAEG
jgi:hypothetical protein